MCSAVKFLINYAFTFAIFTYCGSTNPLTIKEEALVQFGYGSIDFTADVYAQLASTTEQSIIFSSLSAQIVLGQTTEGARNQTLRQLVKVLHLPNKCLWHSAVEQLNLNISLDDLKLLSANKLFIAENYPILDSFLSVSKEVYNSEIEHLDFGNNEAAANTINAWVEAHTNNKIKNLVSANSLSSATRLVLVNALYLNAKWESPFQTALTWADDFYLNNGSTIEVQMMHSSSSGGSSYKYFSSSKLDAKFLQMDFLSTNLSMTFVLPNTIGGIELIEDNLAECLAPQNYSYQRVSVAIPKFEITSDSMDFTSILVELGATDVFNPNLANLSGISTESDLYVTSVVQKAFINVTETGVEAAAATAVVVGITSIITTPPPLSFIANHTFIYYISDRVSGIVFFTGKFTGL